MLSSRKRPASSACGLRAGLRACDLAGAFVLDADFFTPDPGGRPLRLGAGASSSTLGLFRLPLGRPGPRLAGACVVDFFFATVVRFAGFSPSLKSEITDCNSLTVEAPRITLAAMPRPLALARSSARVAIVILPLWRWTFCRTYCSCPERKCQG